MKKNRIGIIGHFAFKKKQNDGQTVKTNEIYDELKKIKKYKIQMVDTQNYSKKKFLFLKQCFNLIKKNDYVIIIVASGGANILIPFYGFLNLFLKKKVCYCAVGSWLDLRVKKNVLLKFFTKKLDKIFVETTDLKNSLELMKFNNVEIMYNFKKVNNLNLKIKREKNKFCIFSRIMKEKGVEDAIFAINKLNNEGYECYLDIYGPIQENYESEFFDLINMYKKNIKYCGNVKSEFSNKYISKYFMLLFPTHYIKEGLPGTLIDAYNSSTPVISSDWSSAIEFVPDNVGYRYEFGNKEKLYEKIKYCLNNLDEVELKRSNTKKIAEKFAPKNAIKPLLFFLNEY